MAKPAGRSFALSPFRRLVMDLMSFSRAVPAVTVERRMNLAALVARRSCCTVRPSWAAVFAKAFALVARSHRELRRSYLGFPWGHLYEHPSSTVALNVERHWHDEAIVAQCLIHRPDCRSLEAVDAIVRHYQTAPMEDLRWYRRAMSMSKLPWPLRTWLWWATLNLFGRRRSHNFGTFGVSTVAGQGASLLHTMPLLTATVHFGLLDAAGCLDVRLTFDHRVLDGAAAARVLVDLENTLHGALLAELGELPRSAAA